MRPPKLESQPGGRLFHLWGDQDQDQFVCGIGSEQGDLADGTKFLEGVNESHVSGLDERHQYGPKTGVQGVWWRSKERTLKGGTRRKADEGRVW